MIFPGPPPRGSVFNLHVTYVFYFASHFLLSFYLLFPYVPAFFFFFRDVQELGGGVVFLSRTESALVVPVRHAHLYLTVSAFFVPLAIS